MRLNLGKKGLINYEFDHSEFLKNLSAIPFTINNNNIIDNIFTKSKKSYSNNNNILNLLENFITYFNSTWTRFFRNGIFNYYNLSKIQRTNCYLENYNKRIKEKLGMTCFPFIYNLCRKLL